MLKVEIAKLRDLSHFFSPQSRFFQRRWLLVVARMQRDQSKCEYWCDDVMVQSTEVHSQSYKEAFTEKLA